MGLVGQIARSWGRGLAVDDNSSRRWDRLIDLALPTVFVAGAIWFAVVSTVGWAGSLSDRHGFRQTQTALTSYTLLNGGPFFRYETPVLGAPWSIPFELPLYQWLAAKMAQITGMGLNAAGQLVNTYRYKPYGGLLAKTGTSADPSFQWVGSAIEEWCRQRPVAVRPLPPTTPRRSHCVAMDAGGAREWQAA